MRLSASELRAGCPLSKGQHGATSDFHCTTWSTNTTHHNPRFTHEEVCGRQEQVCEEWGHLKSSSTHPHITMFAVRLTSPPTPLSLTVGRSSELVATLTTTDACVNLSLGLHPVSYPRTSLQHCVGWSKTAKRFQVVSMEFSGLQSSCVRSKRQL